MKYLKYTLLLLLRYWRVTLGVVLAVLLGLLGWKAYRTIRDNGSLFSVDHPQHIQQTPQEIRALRDIGQWEFLSVATEELVEHHEAHAFGDHHLVKIFRGTLRIGIDMQQAGDDWFTTDSLGTAILLLPPVGLLDDNFIDETATTTFYEKGSFSSAVKQKLYDKAHDAMKARCLTEANLQQARTSAEEQFTKVFHALGYPEVIINYAARTDSCAATPQL